VIRDWNFAHLWSLHRAEEKSAGRQNLRTTLRLAGLYCGHRELSLIQGDIVLTQEDNVSQKPFPDGCVAHELGSGSALSKGTKQYMKTYAD